VFKLSWPPVSGRWMRRRLFPVRFGFFVSLLLSYLLGMCTGPRGVELPTALFLHVWRAEAVAADTEQALDQAVYDLAACSGSLEVAVADKLDAQEDLRIFLEERRGKLLTMWEFALEFPWLCGEEGRLTVRSVPSSPVW